MRKTYARALCKAGHTPVLDGFTCKAGKKFSAALRPVAGPGGGKVEFAFDDRKPTLDHGSHQGLSRQRQRDAGGRGNGSLDHAAPHVRARRTATGGRSRDGGEEFNPPPY
jgi:DNA topoisomerase-3